MTISQAKPWPLYQSIAMFGPQISLPSHDKENMPNTNFSSKENSTRWRPCTAHTTARSACRTHWVCLTSCGTSYVEVRAARAHKDCYLLAFLGCDHHGWSMASIVSVARRHKVIWDASMYMCSFHSGSLRESWDVQACENRGKSTTLIWLQEGCMSVNLVNWCFVGFNWNLLLKF